MTNDFVPESVLIYVGLDLVGDALIKLPFLRAIRATWPAAKITWLAGVGRTAYGHELAPLVEGLIDEIIEEAGFETSRGKILTRPLGGRHFDLVIDTQRSLYTSLLVRRIHHRVFVSSAGDFLLSEKKPSGRWKRPPSLIGLLMALLDVAADGQAPALSDMPPAAIDSVSEKQAAALLPNGPVYIGFAPGAGGQHKRWPLENFMAIASHQARAGRTPVFVLGPGEAGLSSELRDAVPGALVPEERPGTGFLESPVLSIALARRLHAAVANDAGVGHILAAGDAPLVSLFGPTSAGKFTPVARHQEVVRAQDFGGNEMTLIPPAAVTAALERLVRRLPPPAAPAAPPATAAESPVSTTQRPG